MDKEFEPNKGKILGTVSWAQKEDPKIKQEDQQNKYKIKGIKHNNKKMVWQVTQQQIPRSRVFGGCSTGFCLLKLQPVAATTCRREHNVTGFHSSLHTGLSCLYLLVISKRLLRHFQTIQEPRYLNLTKDPCSLKCSRFLKRLTNCFGRTFIILI